MSDLRSELTAIYRKRGELTPQSVVDEARPDGAPLHSRFEWDDSIAGEKYRIVQAQHLIRAVKIEYTDAAGEKKRVRGFFPIRDIEEDSSDKAGYSPTEDIVQDEVCLRILMRQLERDIADLKRKYGHLAEFANIMRAEFGGETAA
jgi:hypothetical protein